MLNRYIFILYCLLIISFTLLNSIFTKENNICKWDISYALMQFDLKREEQCKKVLNLLDILNITYFFSEGSALGVIEIMVLY